MNTVTGHGWQLLPIWVGAQAPCTPLGNTTKISARSERRDQPGVLEGLAAADRAAALGLGWLAPVYFDMEAYPSGGACTEALRASRSAGRTHCTSADTSPATTAACARASSTRRAVDPAAPQPDRRGVDRGVERRTEHLRVQQPGCALWDGWWSNHRRVHQFQGGHDEVWGGATITMDSNAVDGPTFPCSRTSSYGESCVQASGVPSTR